MTDSNRFRENALACEALAKRAGLSGDRQAFLKMAADWRQLEEAARLKEASESRSPWQPAGSGPNTSPPNPEPPPDGLISGDLRKP